MRVHFNIPEHLLVPHGPWNSTKWVYNQGVVMTEQDVIYPGRVKKHLLGAHDVILLSREEKTNLLFPFRKLIF
jgi:hypothetical protein